MLGGCAIKSWASTQAFVSLSSAESEYYGVVKASSVGLGIKSMMADLGFRLDLEVLTDALLQRGSRPGED